MIHFFTTESPRTLREEKKSCAQSRKAMICLNVIVDLGVEMNSISLSNDSLRLCGFARNSSLGVLGDSVVKIGSFHPARSIIVNRSGFNAIS
jgi:hypothetical protein